MIFELYLSRSKFASGIVLIFILIFQSTAFSQTGSLIGHVYDIQSKATLVGANIIIKGTSLGAASDLDGKYVIRNIPSGRQIIIVSYIGYNSDSMAVNIPRNKTLQQNFYLKPQAVLGKTVTITAQAQGQVGAIQQQLTSNKIENVVSEARIQALPDFNAAQAIGRLPGISTLQSSGEADKVVIRGLAPKYNRITIGGVGLASTGSDQIGITSQGGTAGNISNDRSVSLASISSYMLKNITVYKALTPDMDADAIGGVVNMELREAPSKLHADLLWQSGYTSETKKYGNYRAEGSISKRFFNNKLGVYLQGDLESYDRNADNMNASYFTTNEAINSATGYRPVRVNTVRLNHHVETRKRYGADLVLDYKLPNGSIKFINMASRLSSNYEDYNTSLDYKNNFLYFDLSGGKNNVDLALNSLDFKNDFGFMQFHFTAANNYSRNFLPAAPRVQFTQTGGIGSSTVNTPPESLIPLIGYGGPTSSYLNYVGLYSSDYKENNQEYKTSFNFPFNFKNELVGYLKVGGEFAYRQHTNSQNTPYGNIGNTDSIQIRMTNGILARWPQLASSFDKGKNRFNALGFGSLYNTSFLNNRFGDLLWTSNSGFLTDIINYLSTNPRFSSTRYSTAANPGGWFDGVFQTMANTYKYIERYYAFYAMSELNYGNLMIVGGVRYEYLKGLYQAYNLLDGRNPATDKAFLVNSYPKNHYWFPMIQGRFKITDWLDLRAAYYQSLSRPDYQQLSPHFTIAYGGGSVTAGNPNLVPAQAYNDDISLTFHSNELGLFSIDGFYKEIKNFTYSTNYALYPTAPAGWDTVGNFYIGGHYPRSGATLYTEINSPYTAYIRGVEVDLQHRFWYLPAPFNGLLIGANYTHISSEARYPFLTTNTTYRPRPLPPLTTIVPGSRAGRLLDQPNDIANAWIGYDYEGFSARVSFQFIGNAVSYIGNYPEQDGFTRNYFRIDATVSQELPMQGLHLYLDLNNINNEDNTSAQKSISGFTNEQNYGLVANLGVRYIL